LHFVHVKVKFCLVRVCPLNTSAVKGAGKGEAGKGFVQCGHFSNKGRKGFFRCGRPHF